MISYRCVLFSVSVIILLQTAHSDEECSPSLDKRMDDCPHGYCCTRDEFFPTYVYCKKMGVRADSCTTRDTESACPCMHGLYCRPNIESATFQSLYGTCNPVDNGTATPHSDVVG